jgi:hypothetical protein
LVLIKRIPNKKDNKLLIIGTSSSGRILNDLEISKSFDIRINVPLLKEKSEILIVLNSFRLKDSEKIA